MCHRSVIIGLLAGLHVSMLRRLYILHCLRHNCIKMLFISSNLTVTWGVMRLIQTQPLCRFFCDLPLRVAYYHPCWDSLEMYNNCCNCTVVNIKGVKCRFRCSNRRCIDPLLPSNVSSSSKHLPTVPTSPHSRHLSNAVPDSNDDSCKDLNIDRTVTSELKRSVMDGADKMSSPSGTLSAVSGHGATEQSTFSPGRRRSQKFNDTTTWSQFRQQRATALSSRSEKVFSGDFFGLVHLFLL